MTNTKACFITFEGIEGVGKSTLQRGLAQELQNSSYPVVITREPGGTPLAELLRDAVLTGNHEPVEAVTELLVMFAARCQHVNYVIKPALAENKIVLCDRFTDSSLAYQGGGRGLPVAWIEQLAAMTHPDINPHLTFWLDAPVDIALQRAKQRSGTDRIESETVHFFERAREAFATLAKNNPQRYYRLDATLPAEVLVAEALKVTLERL